MPDRVMTPRRFEALGAQLIPALEGADQALGLIVVGLAPLVETDVNTPFNADVAPAFDAIAAIDDPTDAGTVNSVLGGLTAGADDIDGQQRDLPGPDADEPTDASDQPFQADDPRPGRDDPTDPTNRV